MHTFKRKNASFKLALSDLDCKPNSEQDNELDSELGSDLESESDRRLSDAVIKIGTILANLSWNLTLSCQLVSKP